MYAHNAGFDFSFLLPYLQFNENALCFKDGQFYCFEGFIPKTKIHIKIYDSLKILQMPLSKIPKFIGLTVEKEVFDYALNTEENFLTQYINYSLIKDSGVRKQMKEISKQIGAGVDEEKFDFHSYSKYYCERDVEVL